MNSVLKILILMSIIALPTSGCIDSVTMDQNGTVTIDPAKSATGTVNVATNTTEEAAQESNTIKDSKVVQPTEKVEPAVVEKSENDTEEEENVSGAIVELKENNTEEEKNVSGAIVAPKENNTEEEENVSGAIAELIENDTEDSIVPENVTPVDTQIADATQNITEIEATVEEIGDVLEEDNETEDIT